MGHGLRNWMGAGLAAATFAANAVADPATFCDGRYAESAKQIEAAYRRFGTLYSGGNHQSGVDTVRGTVQLYRIMSGLEVIPPGEPWPKIDLHEPEHRPENWTAETIRQDLRVMTGGDPAPFAAGFFASAAHLDMMTSVGPASDWWLHPDLFADNSPRAYRRQRVTGLSPLQRRVADLTRQEPALDWLQAALALSAAPYELYPALRPDWSAADKSLYAHILDKAAEADRPGPWLALAVLATREERQLPDDLEKTVYAMRRSVERCEANPAAYTILAVGVAPKGEAWLPAFRQEAEWMRRARQLSARVGTYPFTNHYHEQMEHLASLMSHPGSLALPLMLSAPDAETAATYAEGPDAPGAFRMLPISALKRVKPNMALARSIALGRTEEADRQIDAFLERYPEYREDADGLNRLPAPVRQAIFALRVTCLSTRHESNCSKTDPRPRHLHRDLSQDWAWAAAVDREFKRWLYDTSMNASYRARTRGMRRTSGYPMSSRFVIDGLPYPGILPDPYDTIHRSDEGFAHWAAWDEIGPLTSDKRMTRTLSLTVIDWVDRNTDTRWKRTFNPRKELMAEALHRVVFMLKHEPAGDIGGEPVAKRAFELLHYRFPDTDWAEQTPYWWEPDHRH